MMSHNTSEPPNLLNLPSELLLKIITLALLPPTDRLPNKDDFTPLQSSRQIYSECRHLAPQLYPASLSYDASTPRLSQCLPTLHQPWQVASLRRLEIRWLYPSHLATFLGIDAQTQALKSKEAGSENTCSPTCTSIGDSTRFLFQEPLINLDILKIYTDDWMSKASTLRWRRAAGPMDIQYGIPGPACEWLVALCQLQGFKQLELVFGEGPLLEEYNERGPFIEGLLRNFAEAMKEVKTVAAAEEHQQQRPPEWTLWHKWTPDEDFGQRITALRTQDLHLHGYPQWADKDVEVLRWGEVCLHQQWAHGNVPVECRTRRGGSEPPSFHVRELLGYPWRRKMVCGHCNGVGRVAEQVVGHGLFGLA